MRAALPLLALALLTSACASHPGESSTATARRGINAAGTPVYAVTKGAWCALSSVASLPIASVAQASGVPHEGEIRRDVYRTVGKACGGPWTLGAP